MRGCAARRHCPGRGDAARAARPEPPAGPSDADDRPHGRPGGIAAAQVPRRSAADAGRPADRSSRELPSRRARPESNMLATDTPRMILERSGGELAIDSPRARHGRAGLQAARSGRAEVRLPSSAAAASKPSRPWKRGLEFLARFQAADGSWQLHNRRAGLRLSGG